MNDEINEINEEPSKNDKGAFAAVFEWVELIALYFSVAIVVLVLLFAHSPVVGTSMNPTLNENDLLIVRKLAYTPKQGDIIVCQYESNMQHPLVKRVIATEGQTVSIDYNARTITVDGVVLNEDYITDGSNPFDTSDYLPSTFTVDKGKVFVMGDNRNVGKSLDSRYSSVGLIDERYVLGKVCLRLMPLSNIEFF